MRFLQISESPIFTPAFRAWFGKSKVVDKNGQPLRCYHGTTADFKGFSYGHTTGADMVGSGFYFTTDPGETTIYSGGDGGRTLAVYLSIQNPLDADKVGSLSPAQVAAIIKQSPILDDALSNWGDVDYEGFDKVFRVAVNAYAFKGINMVKGLFSLANDFFGDEHTREFNIAANKVLKYDGVFKKHPEPMGSHWVAWFPNQIKSAMNVGTFDPNSDDIAEEESPIVEAPLGDFAIHGDQYNAGSYAQNDVKAFNSEKWFKKVQSHFAKTPFNFNIYLYNAPGGEFAPYLNDRNTKTKNLQQFYRGRLTGQEAQNLQEILGFQIPVDRNGITMIMTDNEGDEKFGLTPWILAHRLAHAIIQQQPGQDGHNIQVKRLTNELYSLVNTVKNTGDQRKLFKFRSAQNDAVIRPGEYVVELMTQYIVQGSISMNDPGEIPFPKFEEQDAEDYDQSSKLQQSMWAFLAKNTQRNMASMNDPNASGRSRVQLLGMYLNKMVGAKPKGEEPMEHWIHRRDEAMQAMKENKFLLMCVDFEHYESRLYQQSRLRAGVHMANDAMEHFLKTCVGGIYVLGTNQGE